MLKKCQRKSNVTCQPYNKYMTSSFFLRRHISEVTERRVHGSRKRCPFVPACVLVLVLVVLVFCISCVITRNAFCGTWYLPHSHVHNERTVPIIMAGCIVHARNGRISTSGEKSDVTIVFLDPNFLTDAKISAIRVYFTHI